MKKKRVKIHGQTVTVKVYPFGWSQKDERKAHPQPFGRKPGYRKNQPRVKPASGSFRRVIASP